MQDAVDALADRLDLREIGSSAALNFSLVPRSAGAFTSLSSKSG
jgi:hypothetical protein